MTLTVVISSESSSQHGTGQFPRLGGSRASRAMTSEMEIRGTEGVVGDRGRVVEFGNAG